MPELLIAGWQSKIQVLIAGCCAQFTAAGVDKDKRAAMTSKPACSDHESTAVSPAGWPTTERTYDAIT
jgi:hypothetical protein